MRVLHQVLGVQYFYLTSHGMGEGNREAIRTGAFWFYRKLGMRAENPEVEALAQSRYIARGFEGNRPRAIQACTKRLAKLLPITDLASWSPQHRRALGLYAPLLCMIPDLST